MTFTELLNEHKNSIKCSTQELAAASELSQSVISRYLSGKRTPAFGSAQLRQLCHGLSILSENGDCDFLSEKNLVELYETTLNPFSKLNFPNKLNTLITVLGISNSSLAETMNFDTSYISKIRNGSRTPADILSFVDTLCEYISLNYNSSDCLSIIAPVLSCDVEELKDRTKYKKALQHYFVEVTPGNSESVDNFLHTVDDFNLNEYIKVIHFDELKVPTMPFSLHTNKDYYGIEEIKNGELDFLKATVLSPSMEPVYLFGDMPMEDMTEGDDFMKKYMFGLAMVLKKGLHIHIVHNLNRPFEELMMGLTGWLPLYMTGQVHPYYFKNHSDNVFGHLNYCSGSVAMEGQCIVDFHSDARYHLTRTKKELEYYKKKTKNLMTKASPLMDIYREETANEFKAFLVADANNRGIRHNILTSLPVYTISDELLSKILEHNNVPKQTVGKITEYVQNKRDIFDKTLSHSEILDEIGIISEEDFAKYPMILSLSDIYIDQDITYTYEEYLEHLELTRAVSNTQNHYRFVEQEKYAFRNIQINIHEGKYAIISKSKTPAINFVVHHPLLLDAIEHFHI